ncbi:MAG: protein BatD [candidate division WOR-3 bacterium]|nr:MAG: protein BatD [candidate division WOR-3 bacterium]
MLKRIGRFLLLFPTVLLAGEIRFVASVDRTEAGLGEPVILTLVVEGEELGQIANPKLPALPDFNIGGTSTSQSTSIQMAGGKSVRRQLINFIYTLYPRSVGESVIGPCELEFGGEVYKTNPISINVLKSGTAPSQPKSPLPSTGGEVPEGDLKLSATTNRKSVYQGEQVIVEYTLYTRLRLADMSLGELPSFNGFWVEPIFDAQRIEFKRRTIDGVLYDYCQLKKTALFPVTSGQLRISPMKLNIAVLQSPRDFFDFFGTTKTMVLESAPLFITVIPLPTENRPGEFTGGVGEFSITSSLDRDLSDAAEPINLTVRIAGSGNIKLLEKPAIPDIPGVKILNPEIKESVRFADNRFQGYKEFNYPLIPQTDGEHIVPAIKIAFFNPKARRYETVETSTLKFTATQTASAVELAQTGGLKVTGSDIRYIKPDVLHLANQRMSAGWWLLFPYTFAFVMIGLSLLYRRHQSRLLSDRAYARKVRSSRLLKSRLNEARRHLVKNREKEFHAALSRVLLGYIGDRYNLEVGALTNESIIEALRDREIEEDKIAELEYLLAQCDMRFSPDTKCDDPGVLYEKAKKLISRL